VLGLLPRQEGLDDGIRLQQYGQGYSGDCSSSGFVVAALMALIAISGTVSKARIRAMLLAVLGCQQAVVAHAVEALWQHVH
jgi:hypothetical protein